MVYVLNHKGSPLEQKLTAIQNEVFVLDYCRPWLGLVILFLKQNLTTLSLKKTRSKTTNITRFFSPCIPLSAWK